MNKIRLTENQLHKVIKESVKRILKEIDNKNNTDIYTIDIFDIDDDNSIDDMRYAHSYYDINEAIEDAKNIANEYSDEEHVIIVSVMAGEYETEDGNIFGDDDAIFAASNKNKFTTMKSRKRNGFVRLDVDYYAE